MKILEPVKKALNYYKSQMIITNYVFPILLKENLTPIQVENRKLKTLKKFNKDLKEIAKIQGINSIQTIFRGFSGFRFHAKIAETAVRFQKLDLGYTEKVAVASVKMRRAETGCKLKQFQRFHRQLETLHRFHWFHWPFATVSKVSPTI